MIADAAAWLRDNSQAQADLSRLVAYIQRKFGFHPVTARQLAKEAFLSWKHGAVSTLDMIHDMRLEQHIQVCEKKLENIEARLRRLEEAK